MTEAGNYAILYMEVILMFKINPYRPGVGLTPAYLVGRDDDILAVDQMFEALKMNIPSQSIIFSGLPGAGKTVLINRLQKMRRNTVSGATAKVLKKTTQKERNIDNGNQKSKRTGHERNQRFVNAGLPGTSQRQAGSF